jgi:hypothetical protein
MDRKRVENLGQLSARSRRNQIQARGFEQPLFHATIASPLGRKLWWTNVYKPAMLEVTLDSSPLFGNPFITLGRPAAMTLRCAPKRT